MGTAAYNRGTRKLVRDTDHIIASMNKAVRTLPLFFTASVLADSECYVDMPGFSHHGEVRNGKRTIYFFAQNRTEAARHLNLVGIGYPCDLSEGRSGFSVLLPRCHV